MSDRVTGSGRAIELMIAWRYVRSRTRNRFISFISLISLLGIAIAVATLIIVLSVMNGFQSEVRDRMLSVIPHASITGLSGRLEDWSVLRDTALAHTDVRMATPFVNVQAMLAVPGSVAGVEARGIRPEDAITGLEPLVRTGAVDALRSGEYRILLGHRLAEALDVTLGEKVVMLVNKGAITPAGIIPRMKRFEVAGIFESGMYEYDGRLAFVHMDDAARLLRLGDAVSGVALSLVEPVSAPSVVREVARQFGGGVYVTDWTRQHASFFRSIELTRSIIFVILLLVVAVAAFNIVSTLVMVVREKEAEIGILRTLGASSRSILAVFVSHGTIVGLGGTLIGAISGVVLAANAGLLAGAVEAALDVSFLSPDVYFINELPSRVEMSEVLRISIVAVVLAVAATLYPAWRAAATDPAEVLRHE